MTWDPSEIANKLRQIERLDAGELAGWHRYATAWREPFPGELAALIQRAEVLGVKLSSPAARKGSTTEAVMPPPDMNGFT